MKKIKTDTDVNAEKGQNTVPFMVSFESKINKNSSKIITVATGNKLLIIIQRFEPNLRCSFKYCVETYKVC